MDNSKLNNFFDYLLDEPLYEVVSFGRDLSVGLRTVSRGDVKGISKSKCLDLLDKIDVLISGNRFKKAVLSKGIVYINTKKVSSDESALWIDKLPIVAFDYLYGRFNELQRSYYKKVELLMYGSNDTVSNCGILQVLYSMKLDKDSFRFYIDKALHEPVFADFLMDMYSKSIETNYDLEKSLHDRTGLACVNPESWVQKHNVELREHTYHSKQAPRKKRLDLVNSKEDKEKMDLRSTMAVSGEVT